MPKESGEDGSFMCSKDKYAVYLSPSLRELRRTEVRPIRRHRAIGQSGIHRTLMSAQRVAIDSEANGSFALFPCVRRAS